MYIYRYQIKWNTINCGTTVLQEPDYTCGRRNLTILGINAPTEGSQELSDDIYDGYRRCRIMRAKLLQIIDKYMNAIERNNEITNTLSKNGEAAFYNNGELIQT